MQAVMFAQCRWCKRARCTSDHKPWAHRLVTVSGTCLNWQFNSWALVLAGSMSALSLSKLHQYIYGCLNENRASQRITTELRAPNTCTSSIMLLLSDEDLSDKQLIRQRAHVIFQYVYKYNVSLWRGSERFYLLHRRARNHFLLTNSAFMLKKFLVRIKISVVSTDEIVTRPYNKTSFTRFSGKVKASVRRSVTSNRVTITYTILKFATEWLKFPRQNLLRRSLTQPSTKEFACRASGSVKWRRLLHSDLSFNCIVLLKTNPKLWDSLHEGPFVLWRNVVSRPFDATN